MTKQDQNLQLIRDWYDAWSRRDVSAVMAACAENFQNHGRVVGQAGISAVMGDILTRFPDSNQVIEEAVAQDDDVVVRSTYSGTHLGVGTLPIDGGFMIGVPPTGKFFSVQHMHWFTLKDGLITNHRATRDDTGMLVQLGLMPPPPIR